jgi:5-oxoprolinase (ATP-hydrolysing) subunit A
MSSHTIHIDLNSDVGEFPAALADGSEARLLQLVSSANIACGGHAGDDSSMGDIVRLCLAYGVSIGAHPSYPDRAGFGRTRVEISRPDLEASISEQVDRLLVVASGLGATVHHVKPHGALYNAAVYNTELAITIANAVSRVDRGLVLVGLAGSAMLDVWKAAGFEVIAEAFADRRYEPDGTLRSRTLSNALILDPVEAARQAVSIARDREVIASDGSHLTVEAQTVCIHGDTTNALSIATAVRSHLQGVGISVASV